MLTTGRVNGHTAVWLENDLLKLTVLPEKGADIYELIYRPTGVDLLLRTPAGLRPPAGHPPGDFLENYEGGWQELLPNVNDACDYYGARVPFHGEVALLPWDWSIVQDDEQETAARFTVGCRRAPLRLERTLRLRRGEPALTVAERLTNESTSAAHLVWGHHVVIGGGFLEGGCRLETAARTLITPDEVYEPATARLAAGQREPWPLARGASGQERVDLRDIPGPEAHSHDDVFLTDLARGYAAVTNPRLGLTFRLDWDAQLFRYICLWQPLGGADKPPLTGIYGLGIEPWVSRYNLSEAIERGEALELGPGQAIVTELRATVDQRRAGRRRESYLR